MALSWSSRRQLLYYVVGIFVIMILAGAAWKIFFTRMPTCSDGVQNGVEIGVDCGGTCSLLCKSQAEEPRILWARSFGTASSTFSAAAYIANPNIGAGARAVHYIFQLYDDKNILVAEREGVTDLPPISTIPIIETKIDVGNRNVARTLFAFTTEPIWYAASDNYSSLRLTEQDLADDGSRVSATLVNNTIDDVRHVAVTAVLFDAGGVARAASKTTLSSVPRKSSIPLVFTWPSGFPNIVRAEMVILPAF